MEKKEEKNTPKKEPNKFYDIKRTSLYGVGVCVCMIFLNGEQTFISILNASNSFKLYVGVVGAENNIWYLLNGLQK